LRSGVAQGQLDYAESPVLAGCSGQGWSLKEFGNGTGNVAFLKAHDVKCCLAIPSRRKRRKRRFWGKVNGNRSDENLGGRPPGRPLRWRAGLSVAAASHSRASLIAPVPLPAIPPGPLSRWGKRVSLLLALASNRFLESTQLQGVSLGSHNALWFWLSVGLTYRAGIGYIAGVIGERSLSENNRSYERITDGAAAAGEKPVHGRTGPAVPFLRNDPHVGRSCHPKRRSHRSGYITVVWAD
jgi:hypothetical protein